MTIINKHCFPPLPWLFFHIATFCGDATFSEPSRAFFSCFCHPRSPWGLWTLSWLHPHCLSLSDHSLPSHLVQLEGAHHLLSHSLHSLSLQGHTASIPGKKFSARLLVMLLGSTLSLIIRAFNACWVIPRLTWLLWGPHKPTLLEWSITQTPTPWLDPATERSLLTRANCLISIYNTNTLVPICKTTPGLQSYQVFISHLPLMFTS